MARTDNDKALLENEAKRITKMEYALGKGNLMPFNNNNSGPRKILAGIQTEHALDILNSEPPIIQTGYEIRFGDLSASIKKTDGDLRIRRKIEKFEKVPGHHYFLICTDDKDDSIQIIERKCYKHNSESYGYAMNNSQIDSYRVEDTIPEGEIIAKSTSYDHYNNQGVGVNLVTAYIAAASTMEDAINISESAAKKLAAPLFKKVKAIANDNDIPLNLRGDDEFIKSFPDIGEEVGNGILFATRREKNEDALFMQSKKKLRETVMSDTKWMVKSGKVIDIDINCNSPEKLQEKRTNAQLLYYYNNKQRYLREIVETVDQLKDLGYTKIKGRLDAIYNRAKSEISNAQYIEKGKVYSGTVIHFTVMEESVPMVGDKITNRYGGKGVISRIIPDELMPVLEGSNTRVEVILNSSTCTNRLNDGQLKELELNFIGSEILRYISTTPFTVDEALKEVTDFIEMCSPLQAAQLRYLLNSWDISYKKEYLLGMIESDHIVLSMEPISESITTDRLGEIYDRFSYVTPRYLYVPIKGSTGNVRMVPSRRPIVCGRLYFYRLKQYAEDKFSVTSLSSTNIRNQNSRNKASKNFKSVHQSTPIRMGEMENGDMTHMPVAIVKEMMMLYSSSPHGRLLMQSIYTDDPYNVDIKLDEKSVDRSAEIFNVRFKTIGLRLKFKKVRRTWKDPVQKFPIYHDYTSYNPIYHISNEEKYDFNKSIKRDLEVDKKFKANPIYHVPLWKMDASTQNKDIETYSTEVNDKANKAMKELLKK